MDIITKTFAEDFISENEIQKSIQLQPKCKFHGKIDTVRQVPGQNDPLKCYGTFHIEANGVSMQGSDQHGDCVGPSTFFPIYDIEKGSYYPKAGEEIYVIINNTTNEVLGYGKNIFDASIEIPLCKWISLFEEKKTSEILSYPQKISIGVGSIVVLGIIIFMVKKYFKKPKHKK